MARKIEFYHIFDEIKKERSNKRFWQRFWLWARVFATLGVLIFLTIKPL